MSGVGPDFPQPLPDEKRTEKLDVYGERITVPEEDIEMWVSRGVYIFSALASGFLLQVLREDGSQASVMILVLLILGVFFFIQFESLAKKAIRKYLPYEFADVSKATLRVASFATLTSVYVTCSYAIMLLMSMWIYGNLSFFEVSVVLIIGVFLIYQFSITYGRTKETLEAARRFQQSKQTERSKHSVFSFHKQAALSSSSSSSSARPTI